MYTLYIPPHPFTGIEAPESIKLKREQVKPGVTLRFNDKNGHESMFYIHGVDRENETVKEAVLKGMWIS